MIKFTHEGKQICFDDLKMTLVVSGYADSVDGTYRRDTTETVRRQNFNDDGWNSDVYVYSCPTCKVSLSGYLCVPYCPNCGQHLDWQDK